MISLCVWAGSEEKLAADIAAEAQTNNVCFNSCQNHFPPDQSLQPLSIICQCQLPGGDF